MKSMPIFLSTALLFFINSSVIAVEHSIKGVAEVSASNSQTLDSYLTGGYGKFRYGDGTQLSLSQLGLHYQADINDFLSAHVIANGYADEDELAIGITEAYLKSLSLPSENGVQYGLKAGIFYPQLSIENQATAWSSPYFVNYSTLNTWIGEELRHYGLEAELNWLGKFRQSEHDFSLNMAVFQGNDTTGALLAWHGWTQSNRQTLWHETIKVTPFPARISGMLRFQAEESDPFLELDNKPGLMANLQWRWRGNSELTLSYYDNHADTRVVEDGQYAWMNRFIHASFKWHVAQGWQFQSQFMTGKTRMNAPNGMAVVMADYQSGYAALIKRFDRQSVALRLEEFSLTDHDGILGDNNDEYGKAMSANYRYQINKGWFAFVEHNWINSHRPSRYYLHFPVKLIERQWQLAIRYYF